MISTGMDGTPAQSYSPKSARVIFVNTFAATGPPARRIRLRAAAMAGSPGGGPARLRAEEGLIGVWVERRKSWARWRAWSTVVRLAANLDMACWMGASKKFSHLTTWQGKSQ